VRIILDEDEIDNCYLEIQLSESDLKKLSSYEPLEKDIGDALCLRKNVNVYIRRYEDDQRSN
jgi:hypothetical protein